MIKKPINLDELIRHYSATLPKFSDGRIDYSTSDIAPVLTCFVKCGEEILLLKRSDNVRAYKGMWNTVAGYLDEDRPLEEKAHTEMREELGIAPEMIVKTKTAQAFEYHDKTINKTWIIFPVLVELKTKPTIALDWEHTEYKWIHPEEITTFDIIPNLDATLARVL